jgi:hypothetical protein
MTPRNPARSRPDRQRGALEAERLIAAYVAPESKRAAIINELIALFDGPQQREAPNEASDRSA